MGYMKRSNLDALRMWRRFCFPLCHSESFVFKEWKLTQADQQNLNLSEGLRGSQGWWKIREADIEKDHSEEELSEKEAEVHLIFSEGSQLPVVDLGWAGLGWAGLDWEEVESLENNSQKKWNTILRTFNSLVKVI